MPANVMDCNDLSPDNAGKAGHGIETGIDSGSLASPPSRSSLVEGLRAAICRIEGVPAARLEASPPRDVGRPDQDRHPSYSSDRAARLATGVAKADRLLGGGFPRAALTEIRIDAVRDGGAGLGFALALAVLFGATARRPLIWIAPAAMLGEAGLPYRPGLAGFGLDPDALVVVRTRRLEDAAWAGEEAARSGAAALTILELRGNPARLSLEGTRRLHTRARDAGRPVLLLRQGAEAEPTAAPLRLHLSPGRAAPVDGLADPRLIGRPRFVLAVEKSRDGRSDHMLLEWNSHDRRFEDPAAAVPVAVASTPAERPDPARTLRPVLALGGARRLG